MQIKFAVQHAKRIFMFLLLQQFPLNTLTWFYDQPKFSYYFHHQTCGCPLNLLPLPPCLEALRTSSPFLTQFFPTFIFPFHQMTAEGISLNVLKSFNLLKTTITVCVCTGGLYAHAPTWIQLPGCYVISQAPADAKNGHG